MTDTLESLRADRASIWPIHDYFSTRELDKLVTPLVDRYDAVLEDAEKKLDTYREWHYENRRHVNALRDALGRLLAVCRVANTSRSLARIAESYGYDAELEMDDARCVLEETR